MPKLYSSRETVHAFKRAGFVKVSQKGSHLKVRGLWKGKLQTVIIPLHKVIAQGTFLSMLSQAAMTEQEFQKFIK